MGCLRGDQVLLTKQAGSRLAPGSQIAERTKSSTVLQATVYRGVTPVAASDIGVTRVMSGFDAPLGVASDATPLQGSKSRKRSLRLSSGLVP